MQQLADFFYKRLISIGAFLAIIVFFFVQLGDPALSPIRADGVGYYSYLPALVLHHDPSYESLAVDKYYGSSRSWWGLQTDPSTGRYRNRYNMGVAVMMAPFFLLGHAVTWLFQSPPGGFEWWRFNYPLDGYSFFYQQAIGMAGIFYVFAGLALLKKWLERYYRRGVVFATLIVLLWGTNLFWYGSGEPVSSHPYSFFLFCLLGLLIPWWDEKPRSLARSAALGAIMGLLVLVRVTNVVAVLLLFYDTRTLPMLGQRIRILWQHRVPLTWAVLCAGVVFLPQLAMWKYASGHWIINSYAMDSTPKWLAPALLGSVLALKNGLLVFTPVLILSAIGILLLMLRRRPLGMASLLTLLCSWYIIASSFAVWGAGGSFSNRYFVELSPFFAFGMCQFFAEVRERPIIRTITIAFVVLCMAWTLFFLRLYCTREMGYYGLDKQALFDIFWSRKHWLLDRL